MNFFGHFYKSLTEKPHKIALFAGNLCGELKQKCMPKEFIWGRTLLRLKPSRHFWHTVDFIGATTCWIFDLHPAGAGTVACQGKNPVLPLLRHTFLPWISTRYI